MDPAHPRPRPRDAVRPVPLLCDPTLPGAGAWLIMPLPLLRRLPALPAPAASGSLAYLGLAEQLSAAGGNSRMTLHRAYVPVIELCGLDQALQRVGLSLPAATLRVPGCVARLRRLPRLDAQVVRFGFRGARLVLADGRQALVTGQQGEGGEGALQVTLGPEEAAEQALIPLRHFADRVRSWAGPAVTYLPLCENS
jgi:hypothetical protein